MSSKYPDELILDLFCKVKRGVVWKSITNSLNKAYDLVQETQDYRNLYHRYKDSLEVSENEKLSLEMIRQCHVARKTNTKNNKKLNEVLKHWEQRDSIVEDFKKLLSKFSSKRTIKLSTKKKKDKSKTNMTMALDISDIHAGLITDNYNYTVIRSRLGKLIRVFLKEYKDNCKSFNVTDVVLSLNGDMIHHYDLHEDTFKSCEDNIPGQVCNIVHLLLEHVIEPLAVLNVPIRIIGTAGNHDRTSTKRAMFEQGKQGYTWIVYDMLKLLSNKLKYNHLEFIIPTGYGVVVDIQGSNILYEHGDMLAAKTDKALEDHMNKRAAQFGIVLEGLRIGHFHSFKQLGRKIIVNGSLMCGDDFSESMGYNTEPTQTIVTYCKSNKRRNSLYRVLPVFLGD